MSQVRGRPVLFKDHCEKNKNPFIEFTTPRPLALSEEDVFGNCTTFQYGLAHSFVGAVKNAQVFGSGFILTEDGRFLLHGLTAGNYPQNLETQLRKYLVSKPFGRSLVLEIDDSPAVIDDEVVLLWGSQNFGHWIFTYLHRLALLRFYPKLRDRRILVLDETPRRFIPWLTKMGIPEDQLVYAKDCSRVAHLWVPSVLHYRGHYSDMNVYIFPEAVHDFRSQVLSRRSPVVPRGAKRERIYISRDQAKWRRVVNEAELARRLQDLNVRRIFIEELSIDEQIDVVSRAELIVMFTGGGSPITMLAPRDAAIIEMSLPGFSGIFGSRVWAQILGQKFSRIDAIPVESSGENANPVTDRDGIVPVEKVAELIEAADRAKRR